MTGNQDVARFTTEAIAHPLRWIVRLQVTCGRQLSQRIADLPERLSRLLRTQFPAVPDDRRLGSICRGLRRHALDVGAALLRERTAGVYVRGNGVGMMDEI